MREEEEGKRKKIIVKKYRDTIRQRGWNPVGETQAEAVKKKEKERWRDRYRKKTDEQGKEMQVGKRRDINIGIV